MTRRPWIATAYCARTDQNPRDWDADRKDGARSTVNGKRWEAIRLCEQCPVLKECAAETLADITDWTGTIRAGVPLWEKSSDGRELARKVLRGVESGLLPDQAWIAALRAVPHHSEAESALLSALEGFAAANPGVPPRPTRDSPAGGAAPPGVPPHPTHRQV